MRTGRDDTAGRWLAHSRHFTITTIIAVTVIWGLRELRVMN